VAAREEEAPLRRKKRVVKKVKKNRRGMVGMSRGIFEQFRSWCRKLGKAKSRVAEDLIRAALARSNPLPR
jgi:hypothetical protein